MARLILAAACAAAACPNWILSEKTFRITARLPRCVWKFDEVLQNCKHAVASHKRQSQCKKTESRGAACRASERGAGRLLTVALAWCFKTSALLKRNEVHP